MVINSHNTVMFVLKKSVNTLPYLLLQDVNVFYATRSSGFNSGLIPNKTRYCLAYSALRACVLGYF